ncbi:MAG TPA: hypothetical protein VHA15_05020 [Burkholderiales bacterium]|jgi:hypothetical protein|nr:hypothetical protein [Burkholderiales bacterium]
MQAAIVALIVAAAFVYAAWILMPGGLRRRLAGALAPLAPSGLRAKLERVESGREAPGCSTCKACATDETGARGAWKAIELRRR